MMGEKNKFEIEFDKKEKNKRFKIRGIFLSIFTVLIVWGWNSCQEEDAPRQQYNSEQQKTNREFILKIEAYNFSKEFISDNLKSPSSAKFPSIDKIKVNSLGNNRYFIKGYVDSQNSYGAMIRTSYECIVVYESGITISLESLNFD